MKLVKLANNYNNNQLLSYQAMIKIVQIKTTS